MRAAAAFSFLLPRAANGARIVAHSKSHRGQVLALVWNAARNGTTSRMSTTSIATLNRITAKKLADLLLADAQQEIEAQGSEGKESKIAIVDVRDDGKFSRAQTILGCSTRVDDLLWWDRMVKAEW